MAEREVRGGRYVGGLLVGLAEEDVAYEQAGRMPTGGLSKAEKMPEVFSEEGVKRRDEEEAENLQKLLVSKKEQNAAEAAEMRQRLHLSLIHI